MPNIHPRRRRNYWAEVSLMLAVPAPVLICSGWATNPPEVALLAFLILPVAAIMCGVIGRRIERRRGGGPSEARWVANLGILIGASAFLLGCLSVSPDTRGVARRYQLTNNLKQIGLALHNYVEVNGRLPPAVVRDPQGRPLYSWRVLILPYLEEDQLYRQFHLDEPWDSPHNLTLLDKMPSIYRRLDSFDLRSKGKTHLQVFVGPGTAFEDPAGEPLGDPEPAIKDIAPNTTPAVLPNFPDGLGNTIFVVDARHSVPWTKPEDIPYAPDRPIPPLGGGYEGDRRLFERSPRISIFSACFADGSVHAIKTSVAESVLRALITRNGGEAVNPDSY